MKTEIICPLYNCSGYILDLDRSLKGQKADSDIRINYILTESDDDSEFIMKENGIPYTLIQRKDFSHSLVRERAARKSDADIICFISQDIVINDDRWLAKLITPIIDDEADATYSRQISRYENIEKYTREYNYPETSFIKTKENIDELGLKTFFFSDSASAISHPVFAKLHYYDEKDMPTNEDMYFAYKLIMNGYRIKYCADSIVYHSHDFSLKELYERYRKTGEFFKQNPYFDDYGTNGSGAKMAVYILKQALKNRDFRTIVRYPFDMAVRYIGMKVGER